MGILSWLFRGSEQISEIRLEQEVLSFSVEAAQRMHPNEFMGLLRGETNNEILTITDVLIIPGTESSPTRASYSDMYVPIDSSIKGSIHSHPTGSLSPSTQDLRSFSRYKVHIILGYPYNKENWRAYNSKGEEISISVTDSL